MKNMKRLNVVLVFNKEKDKPRRFKNLDKSEVIRSIEGDKNGMDI